MEIFFVITAVIKLIALFAVHGTFGWCLGKAYPSKTPEFWICVIIYMAGLITLSFS